MKSGKRVFTDTDGKKYQFNCEAFSGIILNELAKMKSEKKQGSKVHIRESLADYLNVSPETVKKWETENGPADIEIVKACAGYFGIDYRKMLILLNNQEIDIMKKNDKEFITSFFKELIDLVYKKQERFKKACEMDEEEQQKAFRDNRKQLKEDLFMLNSFIDKNALSVSANTRNKAHRIVIEAYCVLYDKALPERWEEMEDCYACEDDLDYGYYDKRIDAISDKGAYCLMDEIRLAEKYGFENNSYPPEEWIDDCWVCGQTSLVIGKDMSLDELASYGFSPDCGSFMISPDDIYIDYVTDALTVVFKHDFGEEIFCG